jgi:hypothetical protein
MYKKCPAVYNVLIFFYKFHSLTADSGAQVGLGIPSSFTKPSLSGHFLYTGRWRQVLKNHFHNCQNKLKFVFKTFKKMRKSAVLDSISNLPDEFSIDEIIERLIIIEKIDKGRQDVKDGKINTEEQAKEKLSKWLN